MKQLNLALDDVHIWYGTNDTIMVSNESTKKLHQFNSNDDAINYLFLNGQREAARALHHTTKEGFNNGY